jgi:hypothetical protein
MSTITVFGGPRREVWGRKTEVQGPCLGWSDRGLGVVSQEVVDIEAGTGDGWFLVDAGVRTMPVVEVSPGS